MGGRSRKGRFGERHGGRLAATESCAGGAQCPSPAMRRAQPGGGEGMGEGKREGRAERNGSGRPRRPLMKRRVTLRTTVLACRMRTATC
eukprot:4552741-Pleurochrysis_carterae.AAC.1